MAGLKEIEERYQVAQNSQRWAEYREREARCAARSFWLWLIAALLFLWLTGCAELGSRFVDPGSRIDALEQGRVGTPVYRADECIGAVVNGVCHGSVIAPPDLKPRCYGAMLNGQCTGPMF